MKYHDTLRAILEKHNVKIPVKSNFRLIVKSDSRKQAWKIIAENFGESTYFHLLRHDFGSGEWMDLAMEGEKANDPFFDWTLDSIADYLEARIHD
jgi:hypothetical protein